MVSSKSSPSSLLHNLSSLVAQILTIQLSGGENGERGANYWVKKRPDGSDRWVSMGPKNMVQMQTGDRCVIHTPGGGGWGDPSISSAKLVPVMVKTGGELNSVHIPRAAGSLAAFEETQGGQH